MPTSSVRKKSMPSLARVKTIPTVTRIDKTVAAGREEQEDDLLERPPAPALLDPTAQRSSVIDGRHATSLRRGTRERDSSMASCGAGTNCCSSARETAFSR